MLSSRAKYLERSSMTRVEQLLMTERSSINKDHNTTVVVNKPKFHRSKSLQIGMVKLARGIMNPVKNWRSCHNDDDDTNVQHKDLANRLEKLNKENANEVERKSLCRLAQDACLETLKEHIQDFLQEHPQASYEQWIQDVHPENVSSSQASSQASFQYEIDHRFYVETSDHRILWNDHHFLRSSDDPSGIHKYVPPRRKARQ